MNLLGAVLYDPAVAVSKATSSLLAMTAFDTTNLRVTVTVPAHGMLFFRIFGGSITGATTVPTILLGVMNGATVVGRVAPRDFPGTMSATTQTAPIDCEFVATGLTPGSASFDLAYAVQVIVASTNIKYGGPNTNAGANAWGGIAFEVWDPQPMKVGLGGGVNTTQWNGVAVATPATAGVPDVNVKNINNVVAATPGAAGGALIAGTNSGTTTLGALTVTGAFTVNGVSDVAQTGDSFARLGAPAGASVSADVAAVKVDTAAVKVKTDFLPSATAGAAGGVFIAGTNAATTITTGLTANITGNLSGSVGSVTGSVASVTGNVGGNVTGSVGSVVGAVGSVTASVSVTGDLSATMKASVTTACTASTPTAAAVTGNVGGNVVGSVASVTARVTANIDQVDGAALTAHAAGKMPADVLTVAGTTQTARDLGLQLDATVSSRAPSSTAVSSTDYTAGRAAKLDNLDAAVSTRMATFTLPANFSTLAITPITGFVTAAIDAAGTRTALGMAAANLDTQLAAIDTDVLSRLSTAAFAGTYVAPDNVSISSIKGKTDSLNFSISGKLDVNVLVVNGLAIKGAGTVANPWNPA